MDAFKGVGITTTIVFHMNVSTRTQRTIELGNLIALGQIWIKVVLAGKNTLVVNRTRQGNTGTNRKVDRFIVHHRERARVAQTNRAHRCIRRGTVGERTSTEHLGLRLDLAMNFKPNGGHKRSHGRSPTAQWT
jgi:hypothetical protein